MVSDGVCVIPYFPLTVDQNACTSLLNRLPVFKVGILKKIRHLCNRVFSGIAFLIRCNNTDGAKGKFSTDIRWQFSCSFAAKAHFKAAIWHVIIKINKLLIAFKGSKPQRQKWIISCALHKSAVLKRLNSKQLHDYHHKCYLYLDAGTEYYTPD